MLMLPACVSGRFTRVDRGGEIVPIQLEGLAVNESSMQQCIDALGAPLVVREYLDGADLIWGWERNSGFSTTATIPLGNARSASMAYGESSAAAQGWTLRFDSDWKLVDKRHGSLNDLLTSKSPPPQLMQVDRKK